MPTVSIIIPTYKEAENLPLLIRAIATALATTPWQWEAIVVDDNSPDATPAVLADLSITFPNVRSLIRPHDRGLSSAVLVGISLARHEYLVVMDADLSHPPESIVDLLNPLLRNDADFVIGSRYVAGGKTEDWSRARWLNSVAATLLAKPLVGSIQDPMAGFFSLRRESLRIADPLNPIGYKIGLELLAKTRIAPRRVVEVPITFRNRLHGESKLTIKEQFRYLEHLSRLYDYVFPKASPRAKFLIAAGIGATACCGTIAVLNQLDVQPAVSLAVGFLAMILVTLVFFIRYVRTQREFTVMKRPYLEFACISLSEFVGGWTVACCLPAALPLRIAAGIMILLLIRYTLRKVFLHDLRGIRSTPKASAMVRLTLASPTAA